jgi:hypothetical protein
MAEGGDPAMDAKQYEQLVSDAESKLKRLRALYDQWFAGIERLEPQQQRKELDHILGQLRREQVRNTALKFRFNQVVQRYTTYTTYWRRITRQIEEGTYKRDVLRARRLAEQLPPSDPPPPRKDGYELDIDVDIESAVNGLGEGADGGLPPVRHTPRPQPISPFAMPAGETAPGIPSPEPVRSFAPPPRPSGLGAPPLPAGAKLPPPPPAAAGVKRPPPPPPGAARPAAAAGAPSPNGIGDDHMRKIYERYVEARRQNQEGTNVKFESVASSVRGMMPKLMQKHAGKAIDFEIVVKDGKVALKPVAR